MSLLRAKNNSLKTKLNNKQCSKKATRSWNNQSCRSKSEMSSLLSSWDACLKPKLRQPSLNEKLRKKTRKCYNSQNRSMTWPMKKKSSWRKARNDWMASKSTWNSTCKSSLPSTKSPMARSCKKCLTTTHSTFCKTSCSCQRKHKLVSTLQCQAYCN